MFNDLKFRVALIVALVVASGVLLFQRGITLGLDLQGGTHLALEVEDPTNALNSDQKADAIERALQVIRTRVDELGVAEPTVQKVGDERIVVELPGASPEAQQRARDVIQASAFLEFKIVRPLSEMESALPRIDRALVAAGVAAPAARPGTPAAPAGGVGGLFQSRDSAADSTRADTARADSAGAVVASRDSGAAAAAPTDTAASARPFSSRLQPGGEGFFVVAPEDVPALEQYLARPEVQRLLPRGTELRWGSVPNQPQAQAENAPRLLYLLESEALITGERLVDAQAQRDPQLGQPMVTFQMDRRGGRVFERGTGEHIGDNMAIVLDRRVFSAPVIQSAIGMNGQIEMGGSSIEEARDLALVLRAGALPAPVRIVEERSIGPSLGADSVQKGRVAGAIGVALVILFVVGYYKLSGAFAVAALALYVVYLLGMMAWVEAALTFPGIAGLVLSIGMAVDANVLVFERIREELAAGRSVRTSVDQGFTNALPAIIDSNLTTLLTCAFLFQFGTGPVRGFAVTLAIGLIASLFTAVFVTKTFFMLYLNRRQPAQALSI